MGGVSVHRITWERMINAVEKVQRRLERAAAALDADGLPYAVADGNAVAAWVATVDESATRTTQDVDMLIERRSLDQIRDCLSRAGFVHRHVAGVDMFLDGPEAKVRDAIQVLFASERVQPDYLHAAPDISEGLRSAAGFRILTLTALVRMKLTSFRDKDRVHLRDLHEVGLLDDELISGLPPDLRSRLQALLSDPSSL